MYFRVENEGEGNAEGVHGGGAQAPHRGGAGHSSLQVSQSFKPQAPLYRPVKVLGRKLLSTGQSKS